MKGCRIEHVRRASAVHAGVRDEVERNLIVHWMVPLERGSTEVSLSHLPEIPAAMHVKANRGRSVPSVGQTKKKPRRVGKPTHQRCANGLSNFRFRFSRSSGSAFLSLVRSSWSPASLTPCRPSKDRGDELEILNRVRVWLTILEAHHIYCKLGLKSRPRTFARVASQSCGASWDLPVSITKEDAMAKGQMRSNREKKKPKADKNKKASPVTTLRSSAWPSEKSASTQSSKKAT